MRNAPLIQNLISIFCLFSFWIATEKLRYMDSENVHESASKIFNEFITPSAPKVIKFDSVMVRAMEEYVYGM